jgi:hypothetical protein
MVVMRHVHVPRVFSCELMKVWGCKTRQEQRLTSIDSQKLISTNLTNDQPWHQARLLSQLLCAAEKYSSNTRAKAQTLGWSWISPGETWWTCWGIYGNMMEYDGIW